MKFLLFLCMAISLNTFAAISQEIKAFEDSSGGRVGVSAIDTTTNKIITYRGNERFPFCSTFKFIGVSAILKANMKKSSLLSQHIQYTKKDLVEYSPVTAKHVKDGMSVAQLCEATLSTSDNSAMNFLMKILGGPKTVTQFSRKIGDHVFNLTRWEPDLNTAIPNDIRDTTSPDAMRLSMQRILLGSVLGKMERNLLRQWLIHNTTGSNRIRSSVPSNWIVGDKTGTGGYGTTNDIAIIYPPNCKPIILVIYFTQKEKNAVPNESVVALVTKSVIHEFLKTDQCLHRQK